HEDKAAGDARLKNLQADRVEFNFNKERGKYVSMTVMFGELAARARVFRLSLEKWGMDRADSIADMFGGGADESRELCEMLGVDPVRFSPVVVEFAQSKSRELVKMWLADVSLLLDAYSYGRFLTPEAQEEFVASEAGAENLLEPPEIKLCEGEVSVFRAPVKISTYDWCRKNLRLVAGPFKDQLWRSDMTPHAKGIMDAFDLPKVEEVFILGPSQTTNKTTIAQGCVLSSLAEKIKPVGVGVTTEKQLKRIMDDRLRRYIEAIPALKRRLRADRFAVQKDEITFDDDSKVYGMWSGSDASYSSASMEIVHLSEVDAYQDWASVFKMLERLDAYRMLGTAKAILESKVRGCIGKPSIYTLARDRAQMWCNIEARCPACGTYQVMTLKRISALDEDGKLVTDPKRIMKEKLGRYQCKCCDYRWSDAVKNAALRAGRWLGDLTGVSSVAFH
ncbi:Bacteriophage lambda, GpA-like protein, partial [Aduncisulcus paluster]